MPTMGDAATTATAPLGPQAAQCAPASRAGAAPPAPHVSRQAPSVTHACAAMAAQRHAMWLYLMCAAPGHGHALTAPRTQMHARAAACAAANNGGCGSNGNCTIEAVGKVCTCKPGWSGANCTTCEPTSAGRPGLLMAGQWHALLLWQPLSLAPGPLPTGMH